MNRTHRAGARGIVHLRIWLWNPKIVWCQIPFINGVLLEVCSYVLMKSPYQRVIH